MSLKNEIKNLQKINKKIVATLLHFVPAAPFVYMAFDVALPLMLKNKDLRKFKNEKTDFQFVFTGMPGTKKWFIEIDHGKARCKRGEIDFPHTIVNATARAFLDTSTGYLNAEKALMSGQMTVSGPVMKMKQFQSILM